MVLSVEVSVSVEDELSLEGLLISGSWAEVVLWSSDLATTARMLPVVSLIPRPGAGAYECLQDVK